MDPSAEQAIDNHARAGAVVCVQVCADARSIAPTRPLISRAWRNQVEIVLTWNSFSRNFRIEKCAFAGTDRVADQIREVLECGGPPPLSNGTRELSFVLESLLSLKRDKKRRRA